MKINTFMMIIITCASLALIYSCASETEKPDIKIQSNSVLPGSKGDVISYIIKFTSKDCLKKLNISPSVLGSNEDSQLEYIFDENSHIVTINYFYVIPDNLINVSTITLTLTVTDAIQTNVYTETFTVFNPPFIAVDMNIFYSNSVS
jgi:hypothetical protein